MIGCCCLAKSRLLRQLPESQTDKNWITSTRTEPAYLHNRSNLHLDLWTMSMYNSRTALPPATADSYALSYWTATTPVSSSSYFIYSRRLALTEIIGNGFNASCSCHSYVAGLIAKIEANDRHIWCNSVALPENKQTNIRLTQWVVQQYHHFPSPLTMSDQKCLTWPVVSSTRTLGTDIFCPQGMASIIRHQRQQSVTSHMKSGSEAD